MLRGQTLVAVTALDNYDNLGGTPLNSVQRNLDENFNAGRLCFHINDNYSGPAANVTIGEFRIESGRVNAPSGPPSHKHVRGYEIPSQVLAAVECYPDRRCDPYRDLNGNPFVSQVDLNEDGVPEYIATSPYYCGTEGCGYKVLRSTSDMVVSLGDFSGVGWRVLPSKTFGYHDIVVKEIDERRPNITQALKGTIEVVLRWNCKTYSGPARRF
jgi:hypothetical protein